jgi:formate--tetrahydrofolate ligase
MELATEATIRPIWEVAEALALDEEHVELHGRHAAKINLAALGATGPADGRLVCVTAVTPTRTGEGKTTTAISLADALARNGDNPVLCLREPSLGPVFGIKGGGTGGGRAQIVPPELVNLHFTGDIHAVGAANNLLAALLEAHLLHGNALGIDPLSITWRRCLDMDDRALRRVVVGLGGRANGFPRETGFDITAASEVMAILAVSRSYEDLRARLGAITVGANADGGRVTAEDLGAAGAMAALLVDAFKPNLVQTLEGTPAVVHCGPFANIAHGNNSVVADLLALELGDYVVTESGFGAEMGFEKFVDIVCRLAPIRPAAVVVVATTQALNHHGAANLEANLRIVHEVGIDPVVAVNRFPADRHDKVDALKRLALELGAYAAEVNDGFERGGAGAAALAEAVKAAAARPTAFTPLYADSDPLRRKLEAVARKAYGAGGIELAPAAAKQLRRLEEDGLDHLPVCMAKTHLSLSHDPHAPAAPRGFTLPIRELRAYTGAGWIVALCGDMQTMPGLPSTPAAFAIEIEGDRIRGLR